MLTITVTILVSKFASVQPNFAKRVHVAPVAWKCSVLCSIT
jgi:hypothetical protein